MLEVVFNDSVKGSMKMAKKLGGERALAGSSEDVFKMPDWLDIGSIKDLLNRGYKGDGGRKAVYRMLFEDYPWGLEGMDDHFDLMARDLDLFMQKAADGMPIRVWRSSAAYSACGYAYVCHLLGDLPCDLRVITMPEYWETSEGTQMELSDWGEIHPEELNRFTVYERSVSKKERESQSKLWQKLMDEDAMLRAVVNGHLTSVSETFYDEFIFRHMPDNPIVTARLIGILLGENPLGIGDGWYAYRLRRLMMEGKIVQVSAGDGEHPYSRVIKKV